jgi:hypothetical protein
MELGWKRTTAEPSEMPIQNARITVEAKIMARLLQDLMGKQGCVSKPEKDCQEASRVERAQYWP